ncbi:MAG: sigma-54 dependent transcriptional regulator [Myxococcota bacterium]
MSTPPAEPKILVVDDEATARSALSELLRDEGYAVRTASDGFKALGHLDGWTPDLVLTDVQMPGMSGVELMAKVHESLPDVPIVVMTAFGSVENAVTALHAGADDYLTKPVHFDQMLLVLRRALARRELHRENERLREALDGFTGEIGWVGSSKSSRDFMALVQQVAGNDAAVLIHGESGTGKGLVARALHEASARAEGPRVVVPCAAIREEALEEELFGERGRLAEARGGTVVLEGVGELPSTAQARLLRFIQQARSEAGDGGVRIVATTDQELLQRVKDGRFHEDLYYQLNVITLRVPTLRERRDDIPLLAMHFVRRHGTRVRGLSDRALGVLLAHDWPGNVRQLEAAIERAVAMCQGSVIEPKDLPRELLRSGGGDDKMPTIPGATMAELERYAILTTLQHVGGSTSRAAEILGISTRKIQYRLNEYRERDPSGVSAVIRSVD